MKLILYETKTLVAEQILNEDAFELWITTKNQEKYRAVIAAFYSRLRIQPSTKYLNITFLDEESGELLEINCYENLHKAMVKHKLYPEFILKGLQNTIKT